MRFKATLAILITADILIILIIFNQYSRISTPPPISSPPTPTLQISPSRSPSPSPTLTPPPPVVIHQVPFTSQAPSAQWDNPIYQNACEEAVILMATAWYQNRQSLPQDYANDQIATLSSLSQELFNTSVDTSTTDTLTIFENYFPDSNLEYSNSVTIQDIISAITSGNLVITPMNGRLLNNPNFTPPGPLEHMVLVIGFDSTSNEFITNDPGTRNGKHYRYPTQIFYDAIQDYPTGDHLPIPITNKVMIQIKPVI